MRTETVRASWPATGIDRREADLPYLEQHLPEALDRIQDGVGRVATIVRAMKELAHPGQGEMTPTDLNRALQNALQLTANAYRYVADPAVDLGELPLVTCLAAEMNQVFINSSSTLPTPWSAAARTERRAGASASPRAPTDRTS